MKILASVVSLQEAKELSGLGVDIIDVKDPLEGSLGAQPPWIIQQVAKFVHGTGVEVSSTLGDLPYQPNTAALAAFGTVQLNVDYIKAGLRGIQSFEQACRMITVLREATEMTGSETKIVPAGYADFRKFGGLHPRDLARAAGESRAHIVMLDTAIKDGSTLFDVLSLDELEEFIGLARELNCQVGLAGAIDFEHLHRIHALAPDIIGIRGALCAQTNRNSAIDRAKAHKFLLAARRELDPL